MKFAYIGETRQKEQVSGVVDAADPTEAKLKLRALQIRPVSLKVKTQGSLLDKIRNLRLDEITIGSVIDLKGMLIFMRQFSSLIDAGVPIVQALDILGKQEKKKLFRQVIFSLKTDIEGGSTLAEAMSRRSNVFDGLFVTLVQSGEVSGTLEKTLRRLSDHGQEVAGEGVRRE